MLKDNFSSSTVVNSDFGKAFSWSLFFPIIALAAASLVGVLLNLFGSYTLVVTIGAIVFMITLILRQDELMATFIIAAHIYVDWYLGLLFASQVLTLVLLILFYLCRSHQHPWREPRSLWLWFLYLALSIYPAIVGALRLYDAGFYYPNIMAGALLTFWLGLLVCKDIVSLQRFFKMLSCLGGLLAIHTLIQAATGVVIFGNSRFDQFLSGTGGAGDYELVTGSGIHRIGSFFVDPNFNGTFFATMIFIALGLFINNSRFMGKIFYATIVLLMLCALLSTYSNGAWIGALAGFIAFILFLKNIRYRILLLLFVIIALILILVLFPTQVNFQLLHYSGPNELSVRIGAWKTGINVIQKYPWTGVGLGFGIYILRAEPLRDPAQLIPLNHPHNSYIEIGAKAGLPVLTLFIVLLLFAIWRAFRNRAFFDKKADAVFVGGIAAIFALSINAWSINAWTFPPIAAIGWIILGALSSPIAVKSLDHKIIPAQGDEIASSQ